MTGDTSRVPVWLPALALAGCAFLRFLPYRLFNPDDLYIYLQFVRNLLARGELAFNAGEPTYGFTSPLWLGLITSTAALLRDQLWAAKICSLLAAIVSPPLVFLLVRRLTGQRAVALCAGLAWSFDTWLVRWSWSGLEGGLSALLPIAILLLYLRARERGRFPLAAAVLSGLAPLVRPEMIGWWLLFGLHAAWTDGGSVTRRARRLAAALVPGLLCTGGFMLFALARFGRALPNTAEAKGSLVPMLSALLPAGARVAQVILSTAALELAACGVAAALFVRRGAWRRLLQDRDPGAVLLMAGWAAGLAGLYAVRGVSVYTRYLLMLLPIVVVGGYCTLAPLWRRGRAGRAAVLLFTGAVLAQTLALDIMVVRPATRNYERSEREVNIRLGRWLLDHTPAGAVVAVPDIGAIAYVSGRRILDTNGLVTPELIDWKRHGRVNDYLAQHPPDIIIDIHPDPDNLLRQGIALRLDKVMSLPFENMFLFQNEPLYYSLYTVRDATPRPEDPPRPDPPGGAAG